MVSGYGAVVLILGVLLKRIMLLHVSHVIVSKTLPILALEDIAGKTTSVMHVKNWHLLLCFPLLFLYRQEICFQGLSQIVENITLQESDVPFIHAHEKFECRELRKFEVTVILTSDFLGMVKFTRWSAIFVDRGLLLEIVLIRSSPESRLA